MWSKGCHLLRGTCSLNSWWGSHLFCMLKLNNLTSVPYFSHLPRDLTVAAVLVGIILLFIVCHSFKFVVNVYEAYLVFLSKLLHHIPACFKYTQCRRIKFYLKSRCPFSGLYKNLLLWLEEIQVGENGELNKVECVLFNKTLIDSHLNQASAWQK